MDCCVVCLQSNCHPFSRITIQSSQWHSEQIQRVVEKHLWWWYLKPQAVGQNISWICKHCWQEISSFHNFYLKVEMVHKQYKALLLTTNLSEPKSKDILAEDMEEQLYDRSTNVKSKEPHSSSELVFTKKQMIDPESYDQNEKNNQLKDVRIKYEPINNEYQINENNLNGSHVKEELVDDSLDEGNIVYNNGNIEQNCHSNHETDYDEDDLTNEDEHEVKESSKSPEQRTILGRLKKNDIIDFYEEFQFRLECDICNSTATTFAKLCSHYKEQHNMRGFAMCCGVKHTRRHLLIDHLCVHKDPNFFKCHKCHRVYSARENLNFHLRKNRCTPKFECNQCGKQFLILNNLMRHKLTHLRPTDDKHICKKCSKTFHSKALLNRHTHTGSCNLECNDCGKIFLQKGSLIRHIKNNCSAKSPKKVSESINDIESHGKNNVTSETILAESEDITPKMKTLPLDISDKSNRSPTEEYDQNESEENCKDDSNLNNVEENKSFRIKAFKNMYTPSVTDDFFREMQYIMKCCICSTILPDFQSLISHYRKVHKQIGYGMCCGKKYYRRGILADHLRLHKDPNLFKCNICNRKLGTRRGLEKHMGICAQWLEEG